LLCLSLAAASAFVPFVPLFRQHGGPFLVPFFSITSLCQGWQRVQKVASKANNEMHPYYKKRVSKVLNTETEHAVVILLGREFQSEVEWGIKEYK